MPSRPRPGTSDEVRRAFIEFFAERGHVHQASSSLVPFNDPSVLLTTAGMQQMIPYMLGREVPPAIRMTSIQKCFRTGDIDEVGNPRNLTFFEMLGNFSIGDYFKESIIPWSWEFITERLQLPAERVYVTIHPTDDEARQLWLKIVPPEKITDLEDNWWGPPGAEGPCGPDSELYYDMGEELGCGSADCAPGCDCDRYLEFWNLVFMQFFQDRQGNRTPLPKTNIDTGSGLERVTAIMQGVTTVYETDLFRPIIDDVAAIAGTSFGRDEHTDYALRVVADHARGVTFLASDGVVPGNEGRGYVMRRIVRRAVRYGRTLGIERPFLESIVGKVISRMAAAYPELEAGRAGIIETITLEEARFAETLAAGTERLNEWIAQAKAAGRSAVDGRLLFQLHDTFGFPFELSEEMIAEAGLSADRPGFDAAMEEQRTRSRAGARFKSMAEVLASEGPGGAPESQFQWERPLTLPGEIVAIGVHEDTVGLRWDLDEIKQGQHGQILLHGVTPFYPEAGGQVGDRGVIRNEHGIFRVTDTRKLDGAHVVHIGHLESGTLSRTVNPQVIAEVDPVHRAPTARHHTITHVLHRTLKDVLGENTSQRGSLVAPHVARFDFNYPRPVSRQQLEEINARMNHHILADEPVTWSIMQIDDARKSGAMAIFGEKYGNEVRVVDIGGWSRELCGGTHVHRAGEVGPAFLLRESGLASGIRRVEVLAGEAAFTHAWNQQERLLSLARTVGAPVDQLEAKLTSLVEELDQAKRDAAKLEAQLAAGRAANLVDTAVKVGEVNVLAAKVEASSRDGLRDMADQLRAKLGTSVVALGASFDGQQAFVVGASRDAIERGINAGDILRQALAAAGGKGGGRPDFAQGGVKEADQLSVALAQVVPLVERAVGGA
ncbi:MAG: alanine--tRNA ligase [Chloroflexi bacterium]|nr:alanine--tRNA ligase [Chloroflexota bacterium]